MSYKYRAKYLSKISIVSSLSIILTACGSGSSNSSEAEKSKPVVPSVTYSTVTGVASAATPLANAQVTANCKDNTGFKDTVTTDNHGKWSAKIDSSKFPCSLEVKSGAGVYHSYVTSAATVNITPFTDLAVALATNQMPVDWYKSGKEISADKLASATNLLVQELTKKNYNVPENFNPFTAVTSASISQLLSDFLAALAANSATIKDYSELLTLVKDGSVSSLPAKTSTVPVTPLTKLVIDPKACQLESDENYYYCMANVLTDFSNVTVWSFDDEKKEHPCTIKKDKEVITVSQDGVQISAKIDAEESDTLGYYEEKLADYLDISGVISASTTNQEHTVESGIGLTLNAQGEIVHVIGMYVDKTNNKTSAVQCIVNKS
jgi:hypothetical protein